MNTNLGETKLKEYYDVALELVIQCGSIFEQGYNKSKKEVMVKSDFFDFVTIYDRQIEAKLTEGLLRAFPESRIVGEEALATAKQLPELTDAPTWIIDPIDGTTNYIHRLPICGISVALAINKQLVVGIIYNPAANELYSAWSEHGAFLNGKPIRVSGATTISSAVVGHEITLINVAAWRDKNLKRAYKLGSLAAGTRCFATAAISLAYVASGTLDAYHVDDLKPWDVAAGVLLVREAGGVVHQTDGGEFDVMKPKLVAAGRESLAQEVIQLIKQADGIKGYTFS
ncbi:inositol monophosphatase ttx-7-like [Drosophila busckii]|uniref:inositol monophosphatase ttx-7-like n=1 Tax=Drosophila busckii TaxID=30019 RepID=UPI00083EDEE9|nr:inositol monophosphatase ttx-7-like [Drosophila busckii]XP_017841867.1 inositol monophosphatase ttx-7-like [Drosophila busckii]